MSYAYHTSRQTVTSDDGDDGIPSGPPTLWATVKIKCGLGFVVLSVIGFAFIVAGLVLGFETSLDRPREDSVKIYQQVVEEWRSKYHSKFTDVSISIASVELRDMNRTVLWNVTHGDTLNDMGSDLPTYDELYYAHSQVHLFAEPRKIVDSAPLDIIITTPGYPPVHTNLTVPFFPSFNTPHLTLAECHGKSGSMDNGICTYELQLRNVCIRVILVNDTYWTLDDGSTPTWNVPSSSFQFNRDTVGCWLEPPSNRLEPSNETWSYGQYIYTSGIAKHGAFPIIVRAVYDPFLVAEALTDGGLWFGSPVAQKVLLSLIFIIIGGVLLIPAGIIFLHYWRTWQHAKQRHINEIHDTIYEMSTMEHHDMDDVTPQHDPHHTSSFDETHDPEDMKEMRHSIAQVTRALHTSFDDTHDPEIVTPDTVKPSPTNNIKTQYLRVQANSSPLPATALSPISLPGSTKGDSGRSHDHEESPHLFVISSGSTPSLTPQPVVMDHDTRNGLFTHDPDPDPDELSSSLQSHDESLKPLTRSHSHSHSFSNIREAPHRGSM